MVIPVSSYYLYGSAGDFGQTCAQFCEDRGLARTFDRAYVFVAIAPR